MEHFCSLKVSDLFGWHATLKKSKGKQSRVGTCLLEQMFDENFWVFLNTEAQS